MTWEIVAGLFVLIGGIVSIVTPIVKLTKSITELTVKVDDFARQIEQQSVRSKEAHKRLWEHNEEQDDKLQEHEIRISNLENKE
ncbi:MAG: hypothetical protein KH033_08880 [Clostridiales bacterium]|jgi:hypothetical protein|nr:hypothetical protein [Clostridiales bacterium]